MKHLILDAGHYIGIQGKQSPDGKIKEWEYVRKICDSICANFKNIQELQIYKSHPSTEMIGSNNNEDLRSRVRMVNDLFKKKGGDYKDYLLVSIHLNAFLNEWNSASGFSAFVSKNCSQSSLQFAETISEEALKRGLEGNRSAQIYFEDFYILRKSIIPSVLTENLFMTNYEDVQFLNTQKGFETIVDMHVSSICKHFNIEL